MDYIPSSVYDVMDADQYSQYNGAPEGLQDDRVREAVIGAIDREGFVNTCNDICEISKAVLNINFGENSLQSTKLISEYSSCDFFEDPKCKECKLLPVCMGGCPHSRVEGKTICHQLNFRMKDYLIEYTRTLVSTT